LIRPLKVGNITDNLIATSTRPVSEVSQGVNGAGKTSIYNKFWIFILSNLIYRIYYKSNHSQKENGFKTKTIWKDIKYEYASVFF